MKIENKYKIGQKVYFKEYSNNFKRLLIKKIYLDNEDNDNEDKTKKINEVLYYEGEYNVRTEKNLFSFKNDKEVELATKILNNIDKNKELEIEKISKKYTKEKDKIMKSFKDGTYKF